MGGQHKRKLKGGGKKGSGRKRFHLCNNFNRLFNKMKHETNVRKKKKEGGKQDATF